MAIVTMTPHIRLWRKIVARLWVAFLICVDWTLPGAIDAEREAEAIAAFLIRGAYLS